MDNLSKLIPTILILSCIILYHVGLGQTNNVDVKDILEYSQSIIVSIQYDCQHTNDSSTHCCSGTILSESYILTSADCINDVSENLTVTITTHKKFAPKQITRHVDEIIIYPEWKHGHKWNNLAILHMSTSFNFNIDTHLRRIRLPENFNAFTNSSQHSSNSTSLWTIEWNSVREYFDHSGIISQQQFKMSLTDQCHKLIDDDNQQFCIESNFAQRNSCHYRPGEIALESMNNQFIQVGILSSTVVTMDKSCRKIYTRLSYYHDWINSIIKSKTMKPRIETNNSSSNKNFLATYPCSQFTVSCGCGKENVTISPMRIIGGEQAVPRSWSMVVSVRLNDSTGHSCSGSILTASYILTSAHCVDGAQAFEVSISAGMHNLIGDFAAIRYAHDIYIHPNWNASDGTYRNDIAILRVFPPLPFFGVLGLTRTCVPYMNLLNEIVNYPSTGSELVIVGWGSTQYGTNLMSETLQQANIYAIDENYSICRRSIYDVQQQFCAGTYGKDPCIGDSGSPIFQWRGNYWEQVGITSYGGLCHHIGSSGVYTRLSYYFHWMESVINISLTTTTQKPPPTPAVYACNKASSCGCGNVDAAITPSRIVGGENALEDSWPMIVSLRFNRSNDHSCGGTILSNSYILTAAHCLRQLSLEDRQYITIAAGMTNRFDPLQIIRNVDRVYMHPDYSNIPNDYRHDIALLHIDTPFPFETNSKIRRTCIHRIDSPELIGQYPKNGTQLFVIGWGTLFQDTTYLPDILQQTQIVSIDNHDSSCLNNTNNLDVEFCAGLPEGGKDSCQGDSGGPIFQWTGQYWEQVGIVSHGKGCGVVGSPGFYTRLSYYYDWIQEILKQDDEHLEPLFLSDINTTESTVLQTNTTQNYAYKYQYNMLICLSLAAFTLAM